MRNPETAAAVREERTVTAAKDIPLLPTVLSRIRIDSLAHTEPGDVFYLATDPGTVWFRDEPEGGHDGYTFTPLAKESWCTQGEVGTGLPEQPVVILHSTRKFTALRLRALNEC